MKSSSYFPIQTEHSFWSRLEVVGTGLEVVGTGLEVVGTGLEVVGTGLEAAPDKFFLFC